jgi:hypothetical protein
VQDRGDASKTDGVDCSADAFWGESQDLSPAGEGFHVPPLASSGQGGEGMTSLVDTVSMSDQGSISVLCGYTVGSQGDNVASVTITALPVDAIN